MYLEINTDQGRKPARSPAARKKSVRQLLLTRLRDEIAGLKTMGFEAVAVSQALGISMDDVRILSPSTRDKSVKRNLSRRALNGLLHGRHAELGGQTIPSRVKHLVKIATAYTLDELLLEPGIGHVGAAEIQTWLKARDGTLRTEAGI